MEIKDYIMDEEQYKEYQKALDLIDNNNNKEAIDILKKLQNEVPKNIRIKFELGKLFIEDYRTRDEGKHYLLDLFKLNDLKELYMVADQETENKNEENAFRLSKDIDYCLLINQDVLFRLGKVELEEGNYTKADEYYRYILNSNTNYSIKIYVTYLKGILEKYLGNRKQAKKYFDKVICKSTKYGMDAMVELGDLETYKGNYEKASKYFDKLLDTAYRNKAILGFAKIDEGMKNIDRARKEYTSLLKTELHDEAILGLGNLKAIEEKDLEAREYYRKLLNTKLRDESLLKLGILELKENNKFTSREYFTNLLKSRLKNFALLNLGKLESIDNNEIMAREYFKRLLEMNAINKNDAIEELEKLEEKKLNKVLTK